MSVRSESIYFLGCDVCPKEFHNLSARSGTEIRIDAGREGWKYRAARPRAKDEAWRQKWDCCPDCPLPGGAS